MTSLLGQARLGQATFCEVMNWSTRVTRVNQPPPVQHPLEVCYDSVVDEPQPS
jgi:hypothetical protein